MVVVTPLEFVKDAICLSGLTGTKLKCDVIGEYYPFWWGITSGGPSRKHRYSTAIVELNAATGEVYIRDTRQTMLGSAGHALELKVREHPHTRNLKVVLIEEHLGCYAHLKKVIRRRWPSISVNEAEDPVAPNSSNIYLFHKTLDEALEAIENFNLGNALFFFDPLRSVKYSTIENVASKRMDSFSKREQNLLSLFSRLTGFWEEMISLPCPVLLKKRLGQRKRRKLFRKQILSSETKIGRVKF